MLFQYQQLYSIIATKAFIHAHTLSAILPVHVSPKKFSSSCSLKSNWISSNKAVLTSDFSISETVKILLQKYFFSFILTWDGS